MDVGALAAVVLGALLATASGVATELWRQRRATRAAARLIWLEVTMAYAGLLGVVALERWPDRFPFSDEAWKSRRDQLALGLRASDFQELQSLYLAFGAIAPASANRSDPVLYWPLLVMADRAVSELAETAGIEKAQREGLRTPLADRIASIRAAADQVQVPSDDAFDAALVNALESFPPELRARAAEAMARARAAGPTNPA